MWHQSAPSDLLVNVSIQSHLVLTRIQRISPVRRIYLVKVLFCTLAAGGHTRTDTYAYSILAIIWCLSAELQCMLQNKSEVYDWKKQSCSDFEFDSLFLRVTLR